MPSWICGFPFFRRSYIAPVLLSEVTVCQQDARLPVRPVEGVEKEPAAGGRDVGVGLGRKAPQSYPHIFPLRRAELCGAALQGELRSVCSSLWSSICVSTPSLMRSAAHCARFLPRGLRQTKRGVERDLSLLGDVGGSDSHSARAGFPIRPGALLRPRARSRSTSERNGPVVRRPW